MEYNPFDPYSGYAQGASSSAASYTYGDGFAPAPAGVSGVNYAYGVSAISAPPPPPPPPSDAPKPAKAPSVVANRPAPPLPPPPPPPPVPDELRSAPPPPKEDPEQERRRLETERARKQRQDEWERAQKEKKEEEERIEHQRRIEAENKKKRKLKGFGAAVSMKRTNIFAKNAFSDASSEVEGEAKEENNNDKKADDEEEETLMQAQKQVIEKTVDWLVKNPEKSHVILETSKNNPKFRFLYEENSVGGRYFLYVKSMKEAEMRVKEVTAPEPDELIVGSLGMGLVTIPPPEPFVPPYIPAPPSTSLPSFSGDMARAAVEAARAAAAASLSHPPLPPNTLPTQPPAEVVGDESERKRKKPNRWGPPIAAAAAPVMSIPSQPLGTSGVVPGFSVPGFALGSVPFPTMPHQLGPVHPMVPMTPKLDPAFQEQLRIQKEMQMLEQRIRDAAKAQLEGELPVDDKFIFLHRERMQEYKELADRYDESFRDTVEDCEANGGVVDGGTWEHRKRAKEMLDTADKALELTISSRGKHSVSDWLPKDELEMFLKKAEAIKTGTQLQLEEDYKAQELGEDNMGFQLLKKAGWKEGEGLGASGEGIVAPVSIAGQGTETTGVGVKSTHEVGEEDTEYDQFRKRMMLAYRFRPNPLNNPRRSYY